MEAEDGVTTVMDGATTVNGAVLKVADVGKAETVTDPEDAGTVKVNWFVLTVGQF